MIFFQQRHKHRTRKILRASRRPGIVIKFWRQIVRDADLRHDVTKSRRRERSRRFVSSLIINLGAISLERTHATFRPFKHRLVKKKIFGASAAVVWITAGGISAGIVPQFAFKSLFCKRARISAFLVLSSYLFCLLTMIVSYSSIAIKIVYGTQSHHRSATNRGRKLTKTLFIVTVVSLLLTLPIIIVPLCCPIQFYTSTPFHLDLFLFFMLYANSLVNPLLYTVRIPEFRRALLSILHCRSQRQPAPGFPLNEM